MFLTRFAASVTVVHRRDTLRASKIMQQRAFANSKISYRWHTVAEDVVGEDRVTGLIVRDTVRGDRSTLPVNGVFVAIGHNPRSELVRGQVELDSDGYVVVDAPRTRTNIPGVFACGDLVDRTFRQAITAAGTGCAAAIDVEKYLEDQH